jgi:vancomycin permeability regulator SanA
LYFSSTVKTLINFHVTKQTTFLGHIYAQFEACDAIVRARAVFQLLSSK